MPSRERACGAMAVMSAPAKRMRPASGATSPVIRLNMVDLAGAVGADHGRGLAVLDGEARGSSAALSAP